MRRRVFAALYDMFNKGSEAAGMREERRQLLAGAEGVTIEVGAGTGLNLDHYPQAVTRLVLAEPDRHMRRRLRRRVDALDRAAEVIDASAERLHFPDATFDTAVVTLVLCSVPNQEVALAEIARVLRPDGRLLFIEHVRSGEPKVAKRQDRFRPLVQHRRRLQPQPGDTGSDRGIRAQSRVGQARPGSQGAQGRAAHDRRHRTPLTRPPTQPREPAALRRPFAPPARRSNEPPVTLNHRRDSCKAAARIRTADPFITSEVLCQLSYGGAARKDSPAPEPGRPR